MLNQTGSPATEVPISGAATAYGFAQPVLSAPLNGVGANRTTQELRGSFGGLMYTTAQSNPYSLSGNAVINTDAATNRVQATLSGNALPSQAAGVSAVTMQYGGLTGTAGSQAFIDDRNFAALESQMNTQQMVVNGSTTQPTGQLYFVSSGAAGAPTSLLPTGTSYCQCQFLQWGYWGGDLTSSNPSAPRIDRGGINTWVAGVQTPHQRPELADQPIGDGELLRPCHRLGVQQWRQLCRGRRLYRDLQFRHAERHDGGQQFRRASFAVSGKAPLTGANYTFSGGRRAPWARLTARSTARMRPRPAAISRSRRQPGPPYMASGIFAGKQ